MSAAKRPGSFDHVSAKRFWKLFVFLTNVTTAVLAQSPENLCNNCDDFGGFEDPSRRLFSGLTCNMLFLPALDAAFDNRCPLFEQFLTWACCAEPPSPPLCPLCGDDENGTTVPDPDRAFPGTGLTCRDLEASAQAAVAGGADCSSQRQLFAPLCCSEEQMDFCAACPSDEDVFILGTASDGQSCTNLILRHLLRGNGTDCSDVSDMGCCEGKPNSCSPEFLCGNASLFQPSATVFSTLLFQDDGLPTCSEFLASLSLSPPDQVNCSSLETLSSFDLGLERGCCQGQAECFVFLDGGEGEYSW